MTAEIDRQYEELQSSLAAYLASDGRLAVIKAPPGSGKTHTLIEVLADLVTKGKRIAVAAQTNNQANDICERLALTHPEIQAFRFASKGNRQPVDFPSTVAWITASNQLPLGPSITVATAAKWALTDVVAPFDLLAIDEAWQMSWADLMQCALLSPAYLMIGDPGQIPPVVTIDVRRWETSPRAPHQAAPDVVLSEPWDNRFVGSLPACRRLPHEAVEFVKPFYDFDFEPYVEPGSRGIDVPDGHRFSHLADGRPLLLTLDTPPQGPPIEVDNGIAVAAATIVSDLLLSGAMVRSENCASRPLRPSDIGVSSTHRVMNSELSKALSPWMPDLRVDTPERWQGLQRPMIIVIHPLSGVTAPSSFDLDTGRLCVMASRQQAGLILLSRDHVGETLSNYIPSADQAPGRPDVVGRGHDAHYRFWTELTSQGRAIPLGELG